MLLATPDWRRLHQRTAAPAADRELAESVNGSDDTGHHTQGHNLPDDGLGGGALGVAVGLEKCCRRSNRRQQRRNQGVIRRRRSIIVTCSGHIEGCVQIGRDSWHDCSGGRRGQRYQLSGRSQRISVGLNNLAQ